MSEIEHEPLDPRFGEEIADAVERVLKHVLFLHRRGMNLDIASDWFIKAVQPLTDVLRRIPAEQLGNAALTVMGQAIYQLVERLDPGGGRN